MFPILDGSLGDLGCRPPSERASEQGGRDSPERNRKKSGANRTISYGFGSNHSRQRKKSGKVGDPICSKFDRKRAFPSQAQAIKAVISAATATA